METITVTDYINRQLDKLYNSTAGRMLVQITKLSTSPTSPIQTALRELDEEVQRLDEEDEVITPTNAVLEKATNRYLELLIATQALILANASAIEDTGKAIAPAAVTAKVFLPLTGQIMQGGGDPIVSLSTYQQMLAKRGIPWRVPPDLTSAVSRFVDSQAWIDRMEGWGEGYAALTRETLLKGIQQGWGPKKVAEILRLHATNIPKHAAENLTRTLQLTAYREHSLAMEAVNGKFITKKIRIASLDARTCLSCISLHGSELAPGQRVDDHYRGRCSEYYVVPGGPTQPTYMQSDSPSGGRQLVPYQTGENWFRSLPVERQRLQASFVKSPGKWNAYQAGNPLSAFVASHQDDVFGHQIVENSIKGAFGEALAQTYYVK